MKPAGLSLLSLVVAASLAAETADPAPPAKTSARLTEVIRAGLPKYDLTAREAAANGTSTTDRDPNALELPKVTVRGKREPRLSPDDLLIPSEVDKKMVKQYREALGEVSPLNRLLNGFSIPILSPSMADRGRAFDRARRLQDLNRTLDLSKLIDPKNAADLKKASADMDRAADWQSRPAGAK